MGRAWISATRTVDNTARRREISIAKHCHDRIFFTVYYLLLNLITSLKFDRQKRSDYLIDWLRARDIARAHPMPDPCHAHVASTNPRNTRETLFARAKNNTKQNIILILSWIGIFWRDIVNSLWAPAKSFCAFRQWTVYNFKILLVQANLHLL